jgi:hypothetical protein
MTSITLIIPDIGIATPSEVTVRLRRLFYRLAAWQRYRNYPSMRRARRDQLFAWSAAMVRHASPRY